jgi:hypothetical protein
VRYFLLRALAGLGLAALFYLAVLAYPQPLFAHYVAHKKFEVWSDRPIDARIAFVLDDAERRLRTSELYSPTQTFRVFICNSSWRMALYSQHFSAQMGGVADTWLTRNIYIRASDIARNAIHSPGPGPISDAAQRPLSYYVAHEATHVMTSIAFGRLAVLTKPQWLVEGYADYVGKGGDFDFAENQALLRADDPKLDYARSGLYRRFHLMVELLIETKGLSAAALFEDPPAEGELLELLRSEAPP